MPDRAGVRQRPAASPRLRVRPLALALALAWASGNAAPPATELPSGAQVRAGTVNISQNAATMTVQQGSQRAVVDWNTFNVGSQAQVNFVQPSASASILNRVLDSRPSEIFGRITSNGQVFLTNASGIYFGPNASVDVGALVASTHGIATQDFMEGRLRLERNGSTGSVINEGRLNALVQEELGGYIALLAPEVRNEGVIIAKLGTVALAAGETITLDIAGSHTLASLTVTPSQIRALVENRNLVQAPGGLIVLSAQAASSLQGGVVSNSGRLEATGMAMRGGRIVLEASDRIENTGVIDASATVAGPAGSVSLAAPIISNSGQVLVDATQPDQAAGSVDITARQFVQGAGGSISAAALATLGSGRGGRIAIDAGESVELGGMVRASAGDASIPVSAADTGPSTAANGDGGEISILAGTSLRLQSAVLDASGAGSGGRIHLEGERMPPTPDAPRPDPVGLVLNGTTQLRTSGRRGQGGDIHLFGESISLLDSTRIDATGIGGGSVLVGGGWQGSGGWRLASQVVMTRDALIDASAASHGDGGMIVLWSDVFRSGGYTVATGTLRARGGSESGHGGSIETSGHYVYLRGLRVNTGSDHGAHGQWLIDPFDITIDGTGGDSFTFPTYNAPGPLASFILDTDVSNALLTGDVTIIGQNITLTSATIDHAAVGLDRVLILQSVGGTLTLTNSTIRSTGGGLKLDIVLEADSYSFTGSTLNTAGGTLSFQPNGASFGGTFTWGGSLSVTDYTGTNSINGLTINNFPTLGGLIIGSPGNTSPITISGPISINGPIMMQGGATAINASINTTFGPISIITTTGDITVNADVVTSDASPVMMNAGETAAAGTPAGGDIVIVGTPNITAGPGGVVSLFSGSIAGSLGLINTVLGSGNARYNSDETTISFTPPLGTLNAIFREQLQVTVAPTTTTPVVLAPTPVQTTVPTLSTSTPPATESTDTSITQASTTSTSVSSDSLSTSTSTSTSTSSTDGTASGGDTLSASTSGTTTDGTSTEGTATTSSPASATTTASGGTTASPPASGATVAPTTATTVPTGATTGGQPIASGTAVAIGGTTASIPTTSSAPVAQTNLQAQAGSTAPAGGDTRIIADTGAGATPAAATVTATATRMASIDAPARSIDVLVSTRVDAAVGGGVSPTTANRAGNAFSTALAQKLAQGQPMAQAMASAERVFQAEVSLPPPRTPAIALSRAIAAGGGDVATSLNTLATTKTVAGSAAFDRSLSAALARGVPMDAAVGAAKVAARQSEQAAVADTTPRAQLASGTAVSSSPQSANPAYQKSLSSMLAQGVSPQAAMARAGQVAEADAAAARADARNPSAGLASGRAEAIISSTGGGASEQMLALALARGAAPGVAMVRAAEIQREEQAAVAADARQPQASLVRSGTSLPVRGADFDRALANALSRGLPPQAALQVANRVADAVAPAPTPESALATGVGLEKLVPTGGSSRTYRAVLSMALSRGQSPARAIETARRAEDANAFRFTVPASAARSLPGNLNDAKVTGADGRPLPSWLRFDPAKRQFIATEVPEGGLPIQAVVLAGQTRVSILISDGPMPAQ